jgi:hypothetical protein
MAPRKSTDTAVVKALKLVKILLITAPKPHNSMDLARKINCSPQSVHRYIEQVELAHPGRLIRKADEAGQRTYAFPSPDFSAPYTQLPHKNKPDNTQEAINKKKRETRKKYKGNFGGYRDCRPFTTRVKFIENSDPGTEFEKFGDFHKKTSHRDRSFTVTMTVSNKREFMRWILAFGVEATILSPVRIRKEFLKTIQGILSLYEKTNGQ